MFPLLHEYCLTTDFLQFTSESGEAILLNPAAIVVQMVGNESSGTTDLTYHIGGGCTATLTIKGSPGDVQAQLRAFAEHLRATETHRRRAELAERAAMKRSSIGAAAIQQAAEEAAGIYRHFEHHLGPHLGSEAEAVGPGSPLGPPPVWDPSKL